MKSLSGEGSSLWVSRIGGNKNSCAPSAQRTSNTEYQKLSYCQTIIKYCNKSCTLFLVCIAVWDCLYISQYFPIIIYWFDNRQVATCLLSRCLIAMFVIFIIVSACRRPHKRYLLVYPLPLVNKEIQPHAPTRKKKIIRRLRYMN